MQSVCFENYLDMVNLTYFGPNSGYAAEKRAETRVKKDLE